MPVASVPGRLGPDAGAVVAADESVPYAAVVLLLDALRIRGVERVSIEAAAPAP